jgi:hypothetical protein
MAKISEYDVTYKAYKNNELVTTFVSNLWGGLETFRRILGPDSVFDSYEIEYNNGVVTRVVDPINWDHPVCCDKCREEAEERKVKKSLSSG